MNGWTLFWLTWVGVGAVAEAIALSQPLGATLSQQVWWLRESLAGRALLWGFLLWAVWHWLIEPERWWPRWQDDALVVTFAALIGAMVSNRARRFKRGQEGPQAPPSQTPTS